MFTAVLIIITSCSGTVLMLLSIVLMKYNCMKCNGIRSYACASYPLQWAFVVTLC